LKIVVLGGAGLTGQCAVRDLLRSKSIELVRVGDYDSESLGILQAKLKKEKDRLEFGKIDVTNQDETASFLKGYEVVINAVQYYHNLTVMSAALRAGVNYLDFGGLFHTTLRQIEEFHRPFRDSSLLGVPGMGAQPGISNLMVKKAVSNLDRVESIEILDGWRDRTEGSSPISFTWSPQTFFDESSKEAIVFENGKYHIRAPFSEPEKVRFPEPVGEQQVYVALHSELATIPKSFEGKGVKKVIWKEGGTDIWKIKFLADLGLTSEVPLAFEGREISPRKFLLGILKSKRLLGAAPDQMPNDFEITRVIASGRSKGKKRKVLLNAFFPPYKPWRASCSQYNVGVPGSIAAQMIAGGKVRETGVLPAEQVFEPSEFFKELKNTGIRISQRIIEK
jgi:saccharopine dehydrogenase-like NADP-dependent oxidoreductase